MARRQYDVLFSMPWAGAVLADSEASGGAEAQVVLVARALAASGLDVAILTMGRRDELPAEVDGVAVLRQPFPPRVRGLSGLVQDLGTLWGVLRAPSAVVVGRVAGRNVAAAALAARLRGARFVYSSAGNMDFDLGGHDRAYNVRMFERAVRSAAAVVVQTEEQVELCRGRFGRDAVVIRSIAEASEPRTGEPQAFIWIGRLSSYKRVGVYIDLARDVPEGRFQLVGVPVPGDAEAPALLERAARELPNLELLEPRPRSELAPLIERAVAVVNTSEHEGMPNVLLEGWSRGVPALVYSHDPNGVVARYGLGDVAGGSRERLAELARSYWAGRGDQSELARRCVEYVRSHHGREVVAAAWTTALRGARA